jgi:electron transport complex protein RnfG
MKNMLKLALSLAAYTVVACVLLALVNGKTAPIIARVKEAAVQESLVDLFPGASFEAAPGFTPETAGTTTIESVYLAAKGGQVVGAVAQATGSTYDKATILVGVNADRTLSGIKFMAISDTPGFGQNARKPEFYGQFAGKPADSPFRVKGDVEAVSGATITSTGVANILKITAKVVLDKYLK